MSVREDAFRANAYLRNGQVDQFYEQRRGAKYHQAKLAERETTMSEADGDVKRKLEKDRTQRDLPVRHVWHSCVIHQILGREEEGSGLTSPQTNPRAIERKTQPEKEYAYEKGKDNIKPPFPRLAAGNRATLAFGNLVIPAMAPFEPMRCIHMNKQSC